MSLPIPELTPLPWSLDVDGDLMAADRTLVAIIPSAKDRALLAAAPEMLAALHAFLDSSLYYADAPQAFDLAHDAIKKAEGR